MSIGDIQTTYDIGEALKELAMKYRVRIEGGVKPYNGREMEFRCDPSGHWTLK